MNEGMHRGASLLVYVLWIVSRIPYSPFIVQIYSLVFFL